MADGALARNPSALQQITSADKLVRNRVLNLMGCQVGRVIAADLLVRHRRRRLPVTSETDRALLRDGIALVEDFVPVDVFPALLAEVDEGEKRLPHKTPAPDKFGIVRRQIGVHKNPDVFPLANKLLLANEMLLNSVRVAEGWNANYDFSNTGTVLKYERLSQADPPRPVEATRDSEVSSGDLHTDTFHYVTKAFLALCDITEENSPFTYVVGSHRLTMRRLLWEYRNSVKPEQYRSPEYHNRMFEAEAQRLGFVAEKITCKANTLILTNTFGFHLRGAMTRQGAVRRMLRLDFRSNPFHW